MFALLKPTFSLLLCPHELTFMLHPTAERSPTDRVDTLLVFFFEKKTKAQNLFSIPQLRQVI